MSRLAVRPTTFHALVDRLRAARHRRKINKTSQKTTAVWANNKSGAFKNYNVISAVCGLTMGVKSRLKHFGGKLAV